MKYFSALTILTSAVILFTGCKKETENGNVQYQLTASTTPVMIAKAHQDQLTLKTTAGTFSWTNGTGHVSELKFEAKGDTKVEYKSKVSRSVNILDPLSNLGSVTVPPGTYDKVEFKIKFEPQGTTPAFELQGSYTNGAGVTTPVIFRVFTPFEFKYENKTTTVVNASGSTTTLNTLLLDALFSGVSESAMNNAVKDNTGTIIISANSNTNLYNLMWGNVDKMLKVEIK